MQFYPVLQSSVLHQRTDGREAVVYIFSAGKYVKRSNVIRELISSVRPERATTT
jgi:uncharacterized protein (DUF3084 family)